MLIVIYTQSTVVHSAVFHSSGEIHITWRKSESRFHQKFTDVGTICSYGCYNHIVWLFLEIMVYGKLTQIKIEDLIRFNVVLCLHHVRRDDVVCRGFAKEYNGSNECKIMVLLCVGLPIYNEYVWVVHSIFFVIFTFANEMFFLQKSCSFYFYLIILYNLITIVII